MITHRLTEKKKKNWQFMRVFYSCVFRVSYDDEYGIKLLAQVSYSLSPM